MLPYRPRIFEFQPSGVFSVEINHTFKLVSFCLLMQTTCTARVIFNSKSASINIQNGHTLKIGTKKIGIRGTIKKKPGAKILGSPIDFSNGSFIDDSFEEIFNIDYETYPDGIITLDGTTSIPNRVHLKSNSVTEKLNVLHNNNYLSGQPIFNQEIELVDANAMLTIDISNPLNKSISLNGGTLQLENDLSFKDDAKLVGSGLVKLNKKRITFGGTELNFSDNIYWDNAADISLNSKTTLSSQWSFSGYSNLNGNGYVLDLTSGGTLFVDNNSTLYIANIAIKGIGGNSGRIVMGDQQSKIYLSNVSIKTDADYSTTVGNIYAEGPSTLLLGGYNWTFDTNGTLTVDGCSLWIDELNQTTAGEVLFGSPQGNHLTLINSGTVKPMESAYGRSDINNTLDQLAADTTTLDDRIDYNWSWILDNRESITTNAENISKNSQAIVANSLDLIYNNSLSINANCSAITSNSNSIINNSNAITEMQDEIELVTQNSYAIAAQEPQFEIIENALSSIDHGSGNLTFDVNVTLSYDLWLSENHSMAANENITINGAGHTINLGKTGNIFTVATDKTLTLENIKLTNFNPERISLGSNANIVFGNATSLEITSSVALNRTYSFAGTTAICANNNEIHLNSSGAMTVQSDGLLTIENARIQDLSSTNLNCQNDGAKIIFNNSNLHLTQDYTFTKGALEFKGDINITGTKIFSFETNQASTIASGAHLKFDIGTTFSYAPSSENKQLISMTDATSVLSLNGCTLKSTATGMQLTKGRLIVNYVNSIESDATIASEGITFGDETSENDLFIEISSGGRLRLESGHINYQNSD